MLNLAANDAVYALELSIQDIAELYWTCLETQDNAGLHRENMLSIPWQLRFISPVKRVVFTQVNAEGLHLTCVKYKFDAARAHTMCSTVGWVYTDLERLGYAAAKQKFCTLIAEYYKYKRQFS